MNDDDLLRALGRLEKTQKVEFLHTAKTTVATFKAACSACKQRPPTREDFEALEDVRGHAEQLSQSLARASRLKLPAAYLREAWAYRAKHRNSSGGPESETFPDFDHLLWQLAQSALWLTDEPRPAHRPSETWSDAGVLVRFLAMDYRNHFGHPSTGTGSPFVKFCREFLPANGLDCPHLATLRKLVAE